MDNSTEQYNVLAVSMNGANKQPDDQLPPQQYTMPGILHFLQTEWARFEMDRAQWEVDRAELQVCGALVQVHIKNHRHRIFGFNVVSGTAADRPYMHASHADYRSRVSVNSA